MPHHQANMPAFVFNITFANAIVAALEEGPKTARELADELAVERHLVNQHLYKMEGLIKSEDRIPVWSLPEEEPPMPMPAGLQSVIMDRDGVVRAIPTEEFLTRLEEFEAEAEELPWGDGTTRWGNKMKPLPAADPQPRTARVFFAPRGGTPPENR